VVSSNAAAITTPKPLAEMDEADWRRAIDVNVTGSFLVCKHAIPGMIIAGGGSIILMASQMSHVAYPGSSAYCTTKGALLQLAKGIALDYVGQGIRANTLSPGGIATHRQLLRFPDMETAQREWGARHPMGRLGEPDEVARAALFLASDDSSFMTGADLLIDGGYVAW
jgi:NAD(P)-dependent dehydrogenase (short-subunit alcohol dehydrogenase family)